ncbi:MAG: hypothetical protein GOMPHAMPRED_005827 [Gomphillus americanus]|uniref:Uncharacterized protein n=1 Tax=Gomphillus americanus TaxID=1940652 RepID=A0A8H3FU24_9LECA|nr:MAG: hypothetical protein GOMPHAMPRED_005827 [Gomphillus americanus]
MAIYRDGWGRVYHVATNIPRPARVWLIATGIFLFLIAVFQHQSPRTISQATSYATNKWQGKPTSQYWDRKGQKAAFFVPGPTTSTQWGSDAARTFWEDYAKALIDGKPSFEKVAFRDDYKPGWFLPTFKSTDMSTIREQELSMTDEQIQELTDRHKTMVDKVKELATRLPYTPGTRGIVYSTEINVMPFLAVSIRMLRRTGTTLPVEVWIYDLSNWDMNPYGLKICNEVFYPLDATCRFVTDHLPMSRPPPYDKPTEKYQNKFDALLFSSFEQVAMLDSDNIPLMPLDDIFMDQPFTNHGLLLWPDYWRNTASPYYYKITGVEEEPPIKRASTESGQIFVNKATHGAALLLSRYYGLYRYHWLHLLSQDLVDEGDKETFQRATRALNLPFYQVAEPPDRIGYRCNESQKPLASGQHHPIDDYFLSSLSIRRENTDDMLQDGVTPRTLFIHCNLPKLDPAVYPIWHDNKTWPDLQRCNDVAHRMWGSRALTVIKYGWDVEKAVWDQMRWVACNTESMQSHWFHPNPVYSNATIDHVCEHFVKLYDEIMAVDGGAAQGLVYQPALTPAPYDPDGEFSRGWESQKMAWAGTAWRWPIAATALRNRNKD